MRPAFLPFLLLGSLFASQAAAQTALPAGASMARLSVALAEPRRELIDGRFWSCQGDACYAARQDGADSQPLWMECGHVAAEFGPIGEYRTGSDTLAPDRLARCNARAKPVRTAAHP